MILHGPTLKIDDPDETMGQLSYECLTRGGNKVAIVDVFTDESITYDTILRRSVAIALQLQKEHLAPDDAIAIISENNVNYLIPLFAALYLGVRVTNVSPTLTIREYLQLLNIAKPKIVFCSKQTTDLMKQMEKSIDYVEKYIVFDGEPNVANGQFTTLADYCSEVDDSVVKNFKPERFDPNETVAVILYSSGTTGFYKGVMQTHRNHLTIFKTFQDNRYLNCPENGKGLMLLPFFHTFGLTTAVNWLLYNKPIVILPKFQPQLFLSTIQNHNVTNLYLVPSLMVFLSRSDLVKRYDLSSVNDIFFGAAPCSQKIIQELSEIFHRAALRCAYGLTEASPMTMFPVDKNRKPSNGGLVLPETQLKIVGPNDCVPLDANEHGEICIKSKILMKGYLNNDTATKESFDADGWFHTGDIGYFDDQGYVFVVDRRKDMIKYKGHQVAPAEIEALLLEHPGIQECSVIGVPDEKCGELPMAYIVKTPSVGLIEEDVLTFVADNISANKRLHGGVKFVLEIPKNGLGKILKNSLREMEKR